jgi:hypothetical protein
MMNHNGTQKYFLMQKKKMKKKNEKNEKKNCTKLDRLLRDFTKQWFSTFYGLWADIVLFNARES